MAVQSDDPFEHDDDPQPGVSGRAWASLLNSQFSEMLFRGPLPDRLIVVPKFARPGSAARGQEILSWSEDIGEWTIGHGGDPWDIDLRGAPGAGDIHRFTWLSHLASLDTPERQARARTLLDSWLKTYGQYDPFIWRSDVLAGRLIAWFRHYKLLLEHTDLVYRSKVMVSLARQARYLGLVAPRTKAGIGRMEALMGLVYVGLCLEEERRRLYPVLKTLARELDQQIGEDGAHVSRNPSIQAWLLMELSAMRADLRAGGIVAPSAIEENIQLLAQYLRTLLMPDDALPSFNGGRPMRDSVLEKALNLSGAVRPMPGEAAEAGYRRLAAGDSVVLMDCAAAPPTAFAENAHAGCLSFEMGAGEGRVIVNCGSGPRLGREWAQALRHGAAHSTLTLGDSSSAVVTPHGDGYTIAGPPKVTAEERTLDDGRSVTARHYGYVPKFGLIHERSLLLSNDGRSLVGSDTLFEGDGAKHRPGDIGFVVRFHLAPGTKVPSMTPNQVSLQLADGSVWVLHYDGASLTIDDSVYVGGDDRARRTQQVVLTGAANLAAGEKSVRWAIVRQGG